MQTYIAGLLFEISNLSAPQIRQREECWYLIDSDNETDAISAALRTGLDCEECFENRHGEMLQWQFAGIRSLRPINRAPGFAEILSRSCLPDEEIMVQIPRPMVAAI